MADPQEVIKARVEEIFKSAGGDLLEAFSQFLPMVSDMCSRAASEALRLHMCPVHERCDGSCLHAHIVGEDVDIHMCEDPKSACMPVGISYEPMFFG
jgi:histone deacetylase complex regulatory component SIN3